MLNTPVVLNIFNRPDKTKLIFNEIAKAKPTQLFVIADGPRPDVPGEDERCLASRAIVEGVDWECRLSKNYSDVNMGCKRRVSSGLDWVFSFAEEAIMLEDDILPSHSFFLFCQELLERYRHDERIKYISGTNYQLGNSRTEHSYFFSRYASFWGWATWRRAWRHYDVDMKTWRQFKAGDLWPSIFDSKYERRYWSDIFEKTYLGQIDTWDYQMFYACWIHGGLAIQPNSNLVSNIGFADPYATHTSCRSPYAGLPISEMVCVDHPLRVERHKEADEFAFDNVFGGKWMKAESSFRGRLWALKEKCARLLRSGR